MGRIISNLLFISMLFCEINSGWAQNRKKDNEIRNYEAVNFDTNSTDSDADYYLVEERVNSKFGGRVTRYKVSNLSLVNNSFMGVGNSRKVTAVYNKANSFVQPVVESYQELATQHEAIDLAEANAEVTLPTAEIQVSETIQKEKQEYVYIDLVKTYEGVLEKGYFSVDMLKKVADSRFFKDDLNKAARWYTKLFEMTSDLEPVYYFRFAQALKSISQNEKAQEMMTTYEFKSSISNGR